MPSDSRRACDRRRRGGARVAGIPAADGEDRASRPTKSPRPSSTALPSVKSGCIVTDVRMPDMSGIELLRRLKELKVAHAGHRHHRPRRRSAGGRGDEGRRGRLPRKAIRRRGLAGRGALRAQPAGQQDKQQARARGASTSRLAALSNREREVLEGWSPDTPTR